MFLRYPLFVLRLAKGGGKESVVLSVSIAWWAYLITSLAFPILPVLLLAILLDVAFVSRNILILGLVLFSTFFLFLSYYLYIKFRRDVRLRLKVLGSTPSTTWSTKTVWAFCIGVASVVPLSIAFALSNGSVSSEDAWSVFHTLVIGAAPIILLQILMHRFIGMKSVQLTDYLNGPEPGSPADQRIIRSALTTSGSNLRPTQTWRSREDFHQRILNRVICEIIFFDGHYLRARLSFIGLYGAPLLAPFLLLIVAPPLYGNWFDRTLPVWSESTEMLFALVAVNWAVWAVMYYFLLCYWILSPIFKTFYLRPTFGLSSPMPIDRHEILSLKRSFGGRSIRIMNIAFVVAVPLYVTMISVFR